MLLAAWLGAVAALSSKLRPYATVASPAALADSAAASSAAAVSSQPRYRASFLMDVAIDYFIINSSARLDRFLWP